MNNCIVCSNEFESSNPYTKTCGLDCLGVWLCKDSRSSVRKCKKCEKQFVGNRMYCSNECNPRTKFKIKRNGREIRELVNKGINSEEELMKITGDNSRTIRYHLSKICIEKNESSNI